MVSGHAKTVTKVVTLSPPCHLVTDLSPQMSPPARNDNSGRHLSVVTPVTGNNSTTLSFLVVTTGGPFRGPLCHQGGARETKRLSPIESPLLLMTGPQPTGLGSRWYLWTVPSNRLRMTPHDTHRNEARKHE